jgi:hypothetical protein
MDGHNSISWNPALEKIIAKEGEKCAGLAWLYTEAERYYSKNNSLVALPVIILSTLTGFLSGSSTMIFGGSNMASIGTGAVSLFTGVLSTIGSYYAWAKKAEACRISALQYSKLQKVIAIEMTLPKNERVPAPAMLKMMRDNVERLLETSPPVPEHVIEKYKQKFKDDKDIAHPEITNGIPRVEINDAEPQQEQQVSIPVQVKTTSGIKIGFEV